MLLQDLLDLDSGLNHQVFLQGLLDSKGVSFGRAKAFAAA